MQLGLVALTMVFLSSVGHSDVLKLSKARRQRRVSTEGPPSCPKGCDRCSEYNGCIKCKPKLFIFLERNDIRQIGVCLASCPMGYFGMRNPEGNNRCTRQRPSECELGEWSQWSSCMKKNKTCGFKKGSQSRVRVPLPQAHSPDSSPTFVPSQTCTSQTERRKCVVAKMPCARERKNKGDRQEDTNRRERENPRGRGRESKDGSRGGGGGGGGGKRRKGQSRTTTAPSIITSSVT
uniref:R-spondin-1 isoform X2 n=1 Tax=Monopterus albus TaxID=43700 RepID=UPI0009B3053B|nr:R-spondin-1 isoform X2 [Monopterus albus]